MAHRTYNIETCSLNRSVCFEAIKKKIEMVHWEVEKGVSKNYNHALSEEVKELLENYHIKISAKAMDKVNDGSIWAKNFVASKNFKEISSKIIRMIQNNEVFTFGIWKYFDKGQISWDHTTPTAVLLERLTELYVESLLTFEAFCKLVETYGFVTIITKEENEALNDANLRQKMPDMSKWYNKDAFARYKAVGIKTIPE